MLFPRAIKTQTEMHVIRTIKSNAMANAISMGDKTGKTETETPTSRHFFRNPPRDANAVSSLRSEPNRFELNLICIIAA